METEEVLVEGVAERISEPIARFTYKSKKYTVKKQEMILRDHEEGLKHIIDTLMDKDNGVISKASEISAVGHRLVHAGEHYTDTVIVNDHVIEVMTDCIPLAPLHNPANIKGVESVTKELPGVPQAGVFDTAYHQTMPKKAYLYPLPLDYYTDKKIRRYGFHGTSHKFVSHLAAEYLGKDIKDLKIITAHIGNGASITAIDGGHSVDTSMGFTPLEGLMMGTRCGDLDPSIPIYMQKTLGLSVDETNDILNKKSGMIGLSGISNDMLDIENKILKENDEDAITAHEVYAYRIKKYIGAYTAAMNGLDVLIFTGGVGENMPILRELVCRDMDYLGIKLDEKENAQFKGGIIDLTHKDSKVKVLKVQTNEELAIALETKRILFDEKK